MRDGGECRRWIRWKQMLGRSRCLVGRTLGRSNARTEVYHGAGIVKHVTVFGRVGWWIQPWFHNIRLPEADFHRAVYSLGLLHLHDKKIALINTLVNRAQRNCSPCNLPVEIDKIMNILSENGYPEHIVKRYTHKFLNTTKDQKIGRTNVQSISGCPGKGNHHEGLKYKSNILCPTHFWLCNRE